MIRRSKSMAPIKWHGGKHYLAKRIIEQMPSHTHYVEPYAGGLAVLLAKDPEGVSEVVNDLDGELTNFWEVLQSPKDFKQFQRLVEAVPFSQDEFERSDGTKRGRLSRAVAFFIRCRQSRQGLQKDFATLSRNRTRRNMNEQVSAWLTAIEGLPDVHARLKRVVILNDDAGKIIRQQDGPKTLFYCDPPYLHVTRTATDAYHYEMTEDDHSRLLDALLDCRGKVILSGYPSSLYAKRLKGWHTVDFQIDNKASSAKTKALKTERLWMNY